MTASHEWAQACRANPVPNPSLAAVMPGVGNKESPMSHLLEPTLRAALAWLGSENKQRKTGQESEAA